MVAGPGIPGGRSDDPVTPQAIAAIFSQSAGISPPAQAEAAVPRLVRP